MSVKSFTGRQTAVSEMISSKISNLLTTSHSTYDRIWPTSHADGSRVYARVAYRAEEKEESIKVEITRRREVYLFFRAEAVCDLHTNHAQVLLLRNLIDHLLHSS